MLSDLLQWLESLLPLWHSLIQPLTRLLISMCIGLLVANIVEAFQWTRPMARLATPLVRLARLGETSGASFSMAFFSPSAANALLSESHSAGKISRRELMLTNLFNSLPSYIVHLPTMLFLLWPALGWPALIYAGLTLGAAAARTLFTVVLGHWLMPPLAAGICIDCRLPPSRVTFRRAAQTAWKRFKRRVKKLILFTIPIYILMYVLQKYGYFREAESWLSTSLPGLTGLFGSTDTNGLLSPEVLSIILLSLAAEIGASLSAAGSALHMGGVTSSEVVFALLIGNILSTPMRTIRHQFPAYAGYYSPGIALQLIAANQLLRAISLIGAAWLYWLVAFSR